MNWKTLTPDEQQIAYLLTEVEDESMIGACFESFHLNISNSKLRSIIRDLSEMCIQAPGRMSNIIGWDLVDLLINQMEVIDQATIKTEMV